VPARRSQSRRWSDPGSRAERDQALDIGEVAGQADRYAYRAGAFAVADSLHQRGEL